MRHFKGVQGPNEALSELACETHFAGKVASLLSKRASDLVKGGWDDGVVANVSNYDIIAIK